MKKVEVWQFGSRSCAEIANASRDAMARPLANTELEIGFASDDGVLLGAFQRACDGPSGAIARGTPGAAVRVGTGTLHVLVALPRLEHGEDQILNRHVRPILRGLGAQYFGRDWISLAHRPVAHVGFAHERASGRTVVEAFIAVRTPFAVTERASHLKKTPATLEEIRGRLDDDALVASIVTAFDGEHVAVQRESSARVVTNDDPPWTARVDEAIGPVCAGLDAAGRMRVGGEFMASFDAVRDLEDRIATQEIRSAVNDAFGAPHTALFGVRSLESFARALEAALLR